MKAKRVKGWACGFCRNIYPDGEHGKRHANECCLCVECGTNAAEYTGRGMRCKRCFRVRDLYSALENMEHAKEQLKKADRNAR